MEYEKNNQIFYIKKGGFDINNYYSIKFEENKDEISMKNSNIETSLSLRKKKVQDYIFEKRKKCMNLNNNDEYNIYENIGELSKHVPKILIEEFDIYEDKLSVVHQFLTNDFTLLHELDFDPDKVKLYILYKLTNLTFDEKPELYEEKSEENLKLVFHDLIKIINESKNRKVLFETSSCIVNLLFSSNKLTDEFRKLNGIWKRLEELSELKIPDITDNIILIMMNLYSNNPIFGKEFIISNYSRYIKQIFDNFFKAFDNETKKEKIELNLFMNGIILIKRLIERENKEKNKLNDFDVVVKMKYLYYDLAKMFTIAVSWIVNEINTKMNSIIYKFIDVLLKVFSAIAQYCDEETYELNEFQDKYFVSSFCSLIRIIILNKNNEIQDENTLNTLNEIYTFLSLLFCAKSDKTQIYCDNKIIILTEELIKKIDLTNDKNNNLILKIFFFFSNYAENNARSKEIFCDEFLLVTIKEFAYKSINDNHTGYNLFCLLENGFYNSDNYCKDLIIKNFTYFVSERMKILYQYIINGKFIKSFERKCKFLLSIISFLEDEKEEYSEVLSNLINLLQSSSLDECLLNIQTNAKGINQDIIAELISKLKDN